MRGIAQGFFSRKKGAGDFEDFRSAVKADIAISEKANKKSKKRGTRSFFVGFKTPAVEFEVHELQDLEESIDKLNSLLSDGNMRIAVKICASYQAAEKLPEVAKLLDQIKQGWGSVE